MLVGINLIRSSNFQKWKRITAPHLRSGVPCAEIQETAKHQISCWVSKYQQTIGRGSSTIENGTKRGSLAWATLLPSYQNYTQGQFYTKEYSMIIFILYHFYIDYHRKVKDVSDFAVAAVWALQYVTKGIWWPYAVPISLWVDLT